MTIKIYAIGKIKEQYLSLGIAEYVKRLKPYCNVEIKEVNDEKVNDNPSLAEIEIVQNKEADSQRRGKLSEYQGFVSRIDLTSGR